ncbi:hypothetical protein [Streptomyces rugosispiralis]|uniref:Uncharacterized protein n=1 Tax=Streptomyces rugosispiralis TaxID=2967341 RepID=A0ABT1UZV8_9ACTN|nr:hypothetical protein [Streptomyces rugosispiralis]MCQ8190667.1 hypothetical protein [Streptomyces rugosispiralis]
MHRPDEYHQHDKYHQHDENDQHGEYHQHDSTARTTSAPGDMSGTSDTPSKTSNTATPERERNAA